MAVTNHERVGRALSLLAEGLAPFVARECQAKYGTNWVDTIQRVDRSALPDRKVSPTDAQFLLVTIWNEWQSVFRTVLGQTERTYVSELREIRNRWAHQDKFTTRDAERALDSMHRLLMAVSAAEHATEVDKLYQDLRRQADTERARSVQRRSAVVAAQGTPQQGLRPWRDLVTPHPDVASGRYSQAEFAADLHQVWRDEAADEYGKPVEFFRRTFLTDGLSKLLLNATRRWRLEGGDPVVELQTNFGGGKTHSLIALYHLAQGYAPNELPGVEAMLAEESLVAAPAAATAVLVGQWLSPAQVDVKPDGTQVRTLWGEMAWQLGGREAFELVAAADVAGTNPGVALVELFRRHSPCLVLIDEWVAYARQLYGVDGLPAGSFDAQFTFAQALAEAARAVEGVLLVVSIPASDIEVGGEGGQRALERIKNVIGRVETSWRPASADEGFEIVRRRIFDDLPAEHAPERDAVVRAYAKLYQSQKGEFPSGTAEGSYERRLATAYPIHPELFDRLYEEWSTLEKFQRTRGVLRLMASVVHELWERDDRSLLIMPGTVPIDDQKVADELTRYLEDGWTPVIEADVDGPNSLPLELDRDNPTLGRYSATRRVARTIYMGSAPTQKTANRGIDDRSIKLGCVQPGETPATFGDALRRLTDQATHLYVDGQRYWYSLQPSVTRLARDRAASHFSDADADEEIRKRLGAGRRERGPFAAVHTAPSTPGDVPDDAEARLVILGPEHAHSAKTDESAARDAASGILASRSSGARRFRNMLAFLAADAARLSDLRDAVRQYLAWRSIDEEKESHNLDSFQIRQIETKRGDSEESINHRIGETFTWLLAPSQRQDEKEVTWEAVRVAGSEPLAVRVGKRLEKDEALITTYSGIRLRMDLDRVPLWRDNHVGVAQLWDDYAQYLYLPRLRDSRVLAAAIADGVAQTAWGQDTFGYAGAFDEGADRYSGLVAGAHPNVVVDSSSMVVRPEVASAQLRADTQENQVGDSAQVDAAEKLPITEERAGIEVSGRLVRFYARTELDSVRIVRDIGDIASAIVEQLSRAVDAEVTITIEVEARSDTGFSEDVRRTVTENARTLKFDTHEFEEE